MRGTALGAALRGKKRRRERKRDPALGEPGREPPGTIVAELPATDPAMVRRAELIDRRRWLCNDLDRLLALPPHARPAGAVFQIADLRERIAELTAAIEGIPTTVELPLDWWTLPAEHPYRYLARTLAAEIEAEAAALAAEGRQDEADTEQLQESIEALAGMTFPTGAEALKALFAQCETSREREELYREWRRRNGWKVLSRAITGRRAHWKSGESPYYKVPKAGGGTRPYSSKWLMCGAPRKRDGDPCMATVWRRGNKPITSDGRCWQHTSDPNPRFQEMRERRRLHAREALQRRSSSS